MKKTIFKLNVENCIHASTFDDSQNQAKVLNEDSMKLVLQIQVIVLDLVENAFCMH